MDTVFILGITAGFFTTLSILPQVIKTHKTKTTRDLSLGMLSMLATGVLLWTIYGILLKQAPLILANSVSFVLVAYVLVMKVRHG